jgi:hypothetical protein
MRDTIFELPRIFHVNYGPVYKCHASIYHSMFHFPDEDLNHPASELNNHGPTTHGWRSNATCSLTPKDIILRFQPARISRIQVLAHQYLIRES